MYNETTSLWLFCVCIKPRSGLECDKWVLTNFDHDKQWFNTLIPPSHGSAAVTGDCISRLNGPMRLILYIIPRQIFIVEIGGTSAMVNKMQ